MPSHKCWPVGTFRTISFQKFTSPQPEQLQNSLWSQFPQKSPNLQLVYIASHLRKPSLQYEESQLLWMDLFTYYFFKLIFYNLQIDF